MLIEVATYKTQGSNDEDHNILPWKLKFQLGFERRHVRSFISGSCSEVCNFDGDLAPTYPMDVSSLLSVLGLWPTSAVTEMRYVLSLAILEAS